MKVPVLIPRVFDHPFTYIAAENKNLKQGDLVIVPFGKNQEIGVVWDKTQETSKKIKFKTVNKNLEGLSLNKILINFINLKLYSFIFIKKRILICINQHNKL